jgi:hypothetical protein
VRFEDERLLQLHYQLYNLLINFLFMQNKILIVEDDTDLSTMYKIKFEKE